MNILVDRYILWRVRLPWLCDGLLYDDCPSLVRVEGRSGSTDLADTRALCTVGIITLAICIMISSTPR